MLQIVSERGKPTAMQAILERPAQLTHYLFFNTPQWIDTTYKQFHTKPVMALAAASAVGSLSYGLCATIAFCLQLPCSTAATYIDKRKTQ